MNQWVFSLVTDKLTLTMQIAKRVSQLAQNQSDEALMIGAYSTLTATLYFLGDFKAARQNTTLGLKIWNSGGIQSAVEEIYAPPVSCLIVKAGSEWHFGEITSCEADLIELSTRQTFAFWLPAGEIFRGWARSICGSPAEGTAWIEDGIRA